MGKVQNLDPKNPAKAPEPGSAQDPQTTPGTASVRPQELLPPKPHAAPPPDAPLSPLEKVAAIYASAGLPDPFTEAILKIPEEGLNFEVADANFLYTGPRPFAILFTFTKGTLPPLVESAAADMGWWNWTWKLHPKAAAYAGGVLHISTTVEAIVYRARLEDVFLFGSNRRILITRLVAPADSKRRIPIERPNIRLNRIPTDAASISIHPLLAEPWAIFLANLSGAPPPEPKPPPK